MADEVGTAYVKVRPDFSSFKGETESGVKRALTGVAKIVTGALAIKGGFDFAKGVAADAARVQKSAETIRDEFGAAGKEVIDFADTTGLQLGIAAHTSEDTAARFGVLFKNIGVGKEQAATMTIELEKLAGSIAAIRGKDPAAILGTLPLALSGSLRGLRQLGFTFDQTQLKNAALQLGLIKTTSQALDPGAKAIAIYSLLTQHLGDYQAQAAAHSNDAYNVQKRLSAEYDHFKEVLGTDLLPIIDKYGLELAHFIDKGEKSGKIQAEINRVSGDAKQIIGDVAGVVKTVAGAYEGFSKVVGGDHNAVKILADAFLLLYTRSKLIKWGLLASGEKLVGDEALTASGKVGGLAAGLGRLKNLGPIAIAIGLDFIPHAKPTSNPDALANTGAGKFLSGLPIVGGLNSQIIKLGDQLDQKLGLESKDKGTGSQAGTNIGDNIFKSLYKAFGGLKKSAADIGKTTTDALAEGFSQGGPHLSDAVKAALKQPVDAALDALDQAKQQLATDIAAMPQAITDAVNQAKQNLNSLAGSLANDVGSFLDQKASQGGPLGAVLTGRLKQLMTQIQSGHATAQTTSIAQELENQLVAKANLPSDASASATITKKLANLADLFNKGALGQHGFDTRVDQILKKAGVDATVIQRTQGVAAADQFRADLAGVKAQVQALEQGPKSPGTGLAATIVKPIDTLRAEEQKISADRKAEAQAARSVAQAQVTEQKKTNTLLAKAVAKLPSQHTSAELNNLLKQQAKTLSPTNTRARQAGTNRHGR